MIGLRAFVSSDNRRHATMLTRQGTQQCKGGQQKRLKRSISDIAVRVTHCTFTANSTASLVYQ